MTGIVIELQRNAVDSNITVSNLLQKAFLVAKKLKQADAINWISNEMKGYDSANNVPKYRKIHGELNGTDHFGRTIPVVFQSKHEHELINTKIEMRSIDEIETIIHNTEGSSLLQSAIPHEFGIKWMNQFDMSTPPFLIFPKTELQKIIGAVRIQITSWSAELEESGIIGAEYSFTAEEVETAKHISIHVGSMDGSQIQVATNSSSQSQQNVKNDINEFCSYLNQILEKSEIHSQAKDELIENLNKIETENSNTNPNKSFLKSCFHTIKRICEGAAGSAIGSEVVEKADIIIKSLS